MAAETDKPPPGGGAETRGQSRPPAEDRREATAPAAPAEPSLGGNSKAAPRRSRWRGLLRSLWALERLAQIGAAIAVGASAIVAVNQYLENVQADRRERTLELQRLWLGGPLREAYARLAGAVEAIIDEVGPLPPELEGEALHLAKASYGERLIGRLEAGTLEYDGDWAHDIESLVDFYSEVEFCAVTELCDEVILKAYFGASIIGFWDYFRPFAERRRAEHYPDYGRRIDALVSRFGALE